MRAAARFLLLSCLACATACRSPLTRLHGPEGGRFTLAVPPSAVEDHSRNLKRLRDVKPGEANTPDARREALAAHGAYLDEALRRRALAAGLGLDPASPFRLELTLTTVGEVRTKYIVYGILSGVLWGVGTGLATHNPRLALGLGAYEAVEESVFWIAGSSLLGRFSAPIVLEARIMEAGRPAPRWEETYYVTYGGRRLKDLPQERRKQRDAQVQASLERALDKLFKDLAEIPGAFALPLAQPLQEPVRQGQ